MSGIHDVMQFDADARDMCGKLSLQEKVDMITGNTNLEDLREAWRRTENFSYYPYTTSGNAAHGIPPVCFSDGPRGVVCGVGESTCFPVTSCRGASFDCRLEEEIGRAIAEEMHTHGANLFGGVCVNVPYHPGWGRAQDSYGEDPFEIGAMAAALITGVQENGVMACVKHLALNSMEFSRFSVNIECDKRAEREVFLPQFKDCLDAGAACFMTSFNKYLGEYCGESRYLIRDVLKGEWGFNGFVISEWFSGIRDTEKSLESGVDVEMPVPSHYGNELKAKIEAGSIPEALLDEAVIRVVRTLLAFRESSMKARGHLSKHGSVMMKRHAALAYRSACEGITMLKNENATLPFSISTLRKLAVIGSLGNSDNLGDHSSGRVFPAKKPTLIGALAELLPKVEIIYYHGGNIPHAQRVAAEADAVVFAVGSRFSDEGEYQTESTSPIFKHSSGGDRQSLNLREEDVELLQKTAPVNKNHCVVLYGGSSFLLGSWIHSVSAVLMAYYPGQEGSRALADILFGSVNPSGKLPFVLPANESQLPEIRWITDRQRYGYYHGYTALDKKKQRPLYPFGFGLSYTKFVVSKAKFHADHLKVSAACTVQNIGELAGDEVIQFYIGFLNSKIDRPCKLLRGFQRVSLHAGEEKRVEIHCPIERIKYYNETTGRFELEHIVYECFIGTSSDEANLLRGEVIL